MIASPELRIENWELRMARGRGLIFNSQFSILNSELGGATR